MPKSKNTSPLSPQHDIWINNILLWKQLLFSETHTQKSWKVLFHILSNLFLVWLHSRQSDSRIWFYVLPSVVITYSVVSRRLYCSFMRGRMCKKTNDLLNYCKNNCVSVELPETPLLQNHLEGNFQAFPRTHFENCHGSWLMRWREVWRGEEMRGPLNASLKVYLRQTSELQNIPELQQHKEEVSPAPPLPSAGVESVSAGDSAGRLGRCRGPGEPAGPGWGLGGVCLPSVLIF